MFEPVARTCRPVVPVLAWIVVLASTAGVLAAPDPTAGTGQGTIDIARDPMCGMEVARSPSTVVRTHRGKTIGFCAAGCAAAWDRLTDGQKDGRLAIEPPRTQGPTGDADYHPVPRPGEKVPLGPGHYFTYRFAEAPKLGTSVLRVEIFTVDGARDTSFVVKGDADMPSMRGAHSTGAKDFSVSAKGVYLLPVPIVMPGDWEIRLTFLKQDRVVLRGAYLFDI